MRFDGYDFIIVGLVLFVGSALLFGKAYLMPSFPMESAQTYLGGNPFQVRNSIVTRHEAIAGAFWLIAALAFSSIGTVRTVRSRQIGYLISSVFEIFVLLAAGVVVWRLTVAVTDRTSRAEYVPILSKMLAEIYGRDGFAIVHGGQYPEEAARGIQPAPHVAKERLQAATGTLDRIGNLLDEPRAKDEDYQAYARRLSRYFPGVRRD